MCSCTPPWRSPDAPGFSRHPTEPATDPDATCGAETVAAIQRDGGSARFVVADLSDLESVANLAQEGGDIDVLVNNAGTGAFMPATGQDLASFEAMFECSPEPRCSTALPSHPGCS
jgi:NAD(P)-dependent dehydrogenase (short-subunit alcohol dehydrogenase family)